MNPDEQPTSGPVTDATISTFEVPAPVPTLREQIEHHLYLAEDARQDSKRLMHLAIAAGIGLATTTLDDASDAADAIAERIQLADVVERFRSLRP